jgi:hypothetical protein
VLRKLIFAAAIVLGGMALSVPVPAAERGGASDDFNQMHARSSGGFGESEDMDSERLAQHRNGLDGDRYWYDGECFPTAPGGCD